MAPNSPFQADKTPVPSNASGRGYGVSNPYTTNPYTAPTTPAYTSMVEGRDLSETPHQFKTNRGRHNKGPGGNTITVPPFAALLKPPPTQGSISEAQSPIANEKEERTVFRSNGKAVASTPSPLTTQSNSHSLPIPNSDQRAIFRPRDQVEAPNENSPIASSREDPTSQPSSRLSMTTNDEDYSAVGGAQADSPARLVSGLSPSKIKPLNKLGARRRKAKGSATAQSSMTSSNQESGTNVPTTEPSVPFSFVVALDKIASDKRNEENVEANGALTSSSSDPDSGNAQSEDCAEGTGSSDYTKGKLTTEEYPTDGHALEQKSKALGLVGDAGSVQKMADNAAGGANGDLREVPRAGQAASVGNPTLSAGVVESFGLDDSDDEFYGPSQSSFNSSQYLQLHPKPSTNNQSPCLEAVNARSEADDPSRLAPEFSNTVPQQPDLTLIPGLGNYAGVPKMDNAGGSLSTASPPTSNVFASALLGQSPASVPTDSFSSVNAHAPSAGLGSNFSFNFGTPTPSAQNMFTSVPMAQDASLGKFSKLNKNTILASSQFEPIGMTLSISDVQSAAGHCSGWPFSGIFNDPQTPSVPATSDSSMDLDSSRAVGDLSGITDGAMGQSHNTNCTSSAASHDSSMHVDSGNGVTVPNASLGSQPGSSPSVVSAFPTSLVTTPDHPDFNEASAQLSGYANTSGASMDVSMEGAEEHRPSVYLPSPVLKPNRAEEDAMLDDEIEEEMFLTPTEIACQKPRDTDMEETPVVPEAVLPPTEACPPADFAPADHMIQDAVEQVMPTSEADALPFQLTSAMDYTSTPESEMPNLEPQIYEVVGDKMDVVTSAKDPKQFLDAERTSTDTVTSGQNETVSAQQVPVMSVRVTDVDSGYDTSIVDLQPAAQFQSKEDVQSQDSTFSIPWLTPSSPFDVSPTPISARVASHAAAISQNRNDALARLGSFNISPGNVLETPPEPIPDGTGEDLAVSAASLSDTPTEEDSLVVTGEDEVAQEVLEAVHAPVSAVMIPDVATEKDLARGTPVQTVSQHATGTSVPDGLAPDVPNRGDNVAGPKDIVGPKAQMTPQKVDAKVTEQKNPATRPKKPFRPARPFNNVMTVVRRVEQPTKCSGSLTRAVTGKPDAKSQVSGLEKRCEKAIRATSLHHTAVYLLDDPLQYIERSAEVICGHNHEKTSMATLMSDSLEDNAELLKAMARVQTEKDALAYKAEKVDRLNMKYRDLVFNAYNLEQERDSAVHARDAHQQTIADLRRQLASALEPTYELIRQHEYEILQMKKKLESQSMKHKLEGDDWDKQKERIEELQARAQEEEGKAVEQLKKAQLVEFKALKNKHQEEIAVSKKERVDAVLELRKQQRPAVQVGRTFRSAHGMKRDDPDSRKNISRYLNLTDTQRELTGMSTFRYTPMPHPSSNPLFGSPSKNNNSYGQSRISNSTGEQGGSRTLETVLATAHTPQLCRTNFSIPLLPYGQSDATGTNSSTVSINPPTQATAENGPQDDESFGSAPSEEVNASLLDSIVAEANNQEQSIETSSIETTTAPSENTEGGNILGVADDAAAAVKPESTEDEVTSPDSDPLENGTGEEFFDVLETNGEECAGRSTTPETLTPEISVPVEGQATSATVIVAKHRSDLSWTLVVPGTLIYLGILYLVFLYLSKSPNAIATGTSSYQTAIDSILVNTCPLWPPTLPGSLCTDD
ncbi:hypothetical protein DL98DRAFT_576160 [Cadophora sp. DSE1049]|nr:hypothetical protein DL98DRAFT_576160 [Cadophora sp. DSE1049]